MSLLGIILLSPMSTEMFLTFENDELELMTEAVDHFFKTPPKTTTFCTPSFNNTAKSAIRREGCFLGMPRVFSKTLELFSDVKLQG